jgi:hypothetical protein
MHFDSSGDKGTSASIELTSTQAELLSLLERKIYHYDSMANQGIIDGTVKLTRVGKMVQVSLKSRSRHRRG